VRIRSEKEGKTFIYNAEVRKSLTTRSLYPTSSGMPGLTGRAICNRFRMPPDEDVHFDDIIRGHIVVNTSTLDDKVLFKSDGMPHTIWHI